MAALSKLASWELEPNAGLKRIMITLANTADAGDTVAITLADYGIAADGLLAVSGWVHTTDGSVIVTAANTTSVSAGVLTVTLVTATTDEYNVIELIGRSDAGDFV